MKPNENAGFFGMMYASNEAETGLL